MESGTTKIMGIVNLNADSFYEPSRAATQAAFRRRVDTLLAQGADILDLGAVSSRPGATDVEVDEEWSRLEPALETLRLHNPGVPAAIAAASLRRITSTDNTSCISNHLPRTKTNH